MEQPMALEPPPMQAMSDPQPAFRAIISLAVSCR